MYKYRTDTNTKSSISTTRNTKILNGNIYTEKIPIATNCYGLILYKIILLSIIPSLYSIIFCNRRRICENSFVLILSHPFSFYIHHHLPPLIQLVIVILWYSYNKSESESERAMKINIINLTLHFLFDCIFVYLFIYLLFVLVSSLLYVVEIYENLI